MANLYFNYVGTRIVLCATASSFLFCSLPLKAQVYNEKAINLNDMAFVARMQNLIEKVKKYVDRLEQRKLLETVMDIKMEVEAYTGKRIDTDKALNEIENNAKKNGAQFKSNEMKKIRNIIHKSAKKHNHKALYMYDCNMSAIDYHEVEYQVIAKSAHKDNKDKNEEEVPLRVSMGVTAALAGYFLGFIPHPYAQTASKFLIATGTGLCIDGTINRLEENEKGKKEKK